MRTALFVTLLLVLFSGLALACRPSPANPNFFPETFDKALYIGVVEVVDIKPLPTTEVGWMHHKKYVLKPLWPYKNLLEESIIEVDRRGINSCAFSMPPMGTMFEAIIFKSYYGLYENGINTYIIADAMAEFSDEYWKKLRDSSEDSKTQAMMDFTTLCSSRDGQVQFVSDGIPNRLKCFIEDQ